MLTRKSISVIDDIKSLGEDTIASITAMFAQERHSASVSAVR